MDRKRIELIAQQASLLLQENRVVDFFKLLTPLIIIIAIGFVMFALAVLAIVGLTFHLIYQSFVDGNLAWMALGLVLFGVEGLAISLGSFEILGGE